MFNQQQREIRFRIPLLSLLIIILIALVVAKSTVFTIFKPIDKSGSDIVPETLISSSH